jgi:hypothetical protein
VTEITVETWVRATPIRLVVDSATTVGDASKRAAALAGLTVEKSAWTLQGDDEVPLSPDAIFYNLRECEFELVQTGGGV